MSNQGVESGAAMAGFDLAVVGATGLLGEHLLAELEARNFPVGELHLLGEEGELGKRLEFRGSHLKVKDAEGFDFTTVRLVFLLDNPELAAMVGEQAASAGCTVIDCSGQFRDIPEVPVVVAGVNEPFYPGIGAGQIVSSPPGCVVPLALLLDVLNRQGDLLRLNLTVMEPASWAGRAGVEELVSQTANLLNARPVSTELFPNQAAFNVIPQVGAVQEDGYTGEEQSIAAELRQLLQLSELPINVTAVQVPTFFGFGVVVHLELASRLGAEEVVELFSGLPEVTVQNDLPPTAISEALEEDRIFVGRVRENLSCYGSLAFWLVFDNGRKGAVSNAVKIAESMLKSYM